MTHKEHKDKERGFNTKFNTMIIFSNSPFLKSVLVFGFFIHAFIIYRNNSIVHVCISKAHIEFMCLVLYYLKLYCKGVRSLIKLFHTDTVFIRLLCADI